MGLLARSWDYNESQRPAWRALAMPTQPLVLYQQPAPPLAGHSSPLHATAAAHPGPAMQPQAQVSPLAALTQTPASQPFYGPEHGDARFLPMPPQLAPGALAMTVGGKESAPFNANAPQVQLGANASWLDRLGAGLERVTDSRLFNTGMALLGNAQNGGDWGGAMDDMRQFSQDQRERQALENAERRQKSQDARESEQWTWAQAERARMSERRQMAEAYINSRPEAERAELRMIDPDQLGDYIQQQRQLDLQMQEMRENRAFRGASLALDRQRLDQDRILNSSMSVLGKPLAWALTCSGCAAGA